MFRVIVWTLFLSPNSFSQQSPILIQAYKFVFNSPKTLTLVFQLSQLSKDFQLLRRPATQKSTMGKLRRLLNTVLFIVNFSIFASFSQSRYSYSVVKWNYIKWIFIHIEDHIADILYSVII